MTQNEQVHPPKWMMQALKFICTPAYQEEIIGDFLEHYSANFHKHGHRVARKKSLFQLLSIVKPNLIFNLNQNTMKSIFNIRQNPLGLLLLTAMGLIVAFVLAPFANLEFQNKTLFGVPLATMTWLIPLFFICTYMFYFLTKKLCYSKTIIWIHTLTTVITTLFILFVAYIGIAPSKYISERHEHIGNVMQVLTIFFVFGQLIFIVNVFLRFIRKSKHDQPSTTHS